MAGARLVQLLRPLNQPAVWRPHGSRRGQAAATGLRGPGSLAAALTSAPSSTISDRSARSGGRPGPWWSPAARFSPSCIHRSEPDRTVAAPPAAPAPAPIPAGLPPSPQTPGGRSGPGSRSPAAPLDALHRKATLAVVLRGARGRNTRPDARQGHTLSLGSVFGNGSGNERRSVKIGGAAVSVLKISHQAGRLRTSTRGCDTHGRQDDRMGGINSSSPAVLFIRLTSSFYSFTDTGASSDRIPVSW